MATRDRDKAQFGNAEANLQRYLPLLPKGFATPQLIDTQKAQVAQLIAAMKSDEAPATSLGSGESRYSTDRRSRRLQDAGAGNGTLVPHSA